MKANTLFCVGLLLTVFSCDKGDEPEFVNNEALLLATAPEAPPSEKIDVNADGVDDFELQYRLFIWDGVKSTGYGFRGTYRPLGTSLMLQKRNDNLLVIPLFNKLNDTVTKDVGTPLEWSSYSLDIVSITSSSSAWPDHWEVSSGTIQDAYYIAIKIKEGDAYKIGWIKIKIDKTSGEVTIVDKELTVENSIVINR